MGECGAVRPGVGVRGAPSDGRPYREPPSPAQGGPDRGPKRPYAAVSRSRQLRVHLGRSRGPFEHPAADVPCEKECTLPRTTALVGAASPARVSLQSVADISTCVSSRRPVWQPSMTSIRGFRLYSWRFEGLALHRSQPAAPLTDLVAALPTTPGISFRHVGFPKAWTDLPRWPCDRPPKSNGRRAWLCRAS
jgi:hypothetical protein